MQKSLLQGVRFEHGCLAAVCENNQSVMVEMHTLIFL